MYPSYLIATSTDTDAESDTEADREYAYKQLERTKDDGSAAYALSRAAIVGRYAEMKGLKALWLIKDIETLALESIERDRITIGIAVAPVALALANHPSLEDHDLSSLRVLIPFLGN